MAGLTLSQVSENAAKLGTQNEYFANVFAYMNDMTELLKVSVDAMETMGEPVADSRK